MTETKLFHSANLVGLRLLDRLRIDEISYAEAGRFTLYFAITAFIAYKIGTLTYNAFFHPLSKFPGPLPARASYLPWVTHKITGTMVSWLTHLHATHGPIIRYAPDSISIIESSAWREIYGSKWGGKNQRSYRQGPNGAYDLVQQPDDAKHAVMRKVFNPAFSEKAMRLQEGLIKGHVGKLVRLMGDRVDGEEKGMGKGDGEEQGAVIDMNKLWNCTTFDIMGDLCFGEPLGMLDSGSYTPWVTAVFSGFKFSIMFECVNFVLGGHLRKFIYFINKEEQKHLAHSAERVDKRLERGRDEQKDIWNLVLKKEGGEGELTVPEMHVNAGIFMLAGTETTATLLSGLTYLLCTHPMEMRKLVAEIRGLKREELTFEVLPRLQYLNACIDEALRVYAVAPEGLERKIPHDGIVVAGQYIPGNVTVGIPQQIIFRRPEYFTRPTDFIPERWLPQPPDSPFASDVKEAFQPFSIGLRSCIGKNLAMHEIRLIFASALWHFDLSLDPSSEGWIKQRSWALWEKPPLMVRVTHAASMHA